jgi:1-acyl-sn-glycerol-3-phosphate acyltransferase
MYGFLRGVMRVVTRTYLVGGLFHVRGQENVPRSGPLLVCPNHASTIDPPMVPAFLPRDDTWSMAKAEYFDKGFTRWLFSNYHAFPVVRHSADRKALKRARDVLDQGQALIVYPEGTRVKVGGLKEAEPGAGFLAQLTQAPVLPVALIGTRDCFPPGATIPRRTRVEVIFGRVFRLPHHRADGSRIVRQDAADAIMLAIAEMLPREQRGVFSDVEGLRARLGDLYRYEDAANPPRPVEAGHVPSA